MLLQGVLNEGQELQIIEGGAEQPADGAGIDSGVEPHQETPQFQRPPAGRQERGDQAFPPSLAIGRYSVGVEGLPARLAAYAGIVPDGCEVVEEFFLSASFSAASIRSSDRGASMTRSRNSVHSSTR